MLVSSRRPENTITCFISIPAFVCCNTTAFSSVLIHDDIAMEISIHNESHTPFINYKARYSSVPNFLCPFFVFPASPFA